MVKRLSCLTIRSLSGRAAAHRAMAHTALFSNSSLRVRYRRYQAHMQKARALESKAEAKAASSTLSATAREVRS